MKKVIRASEERHQRGRYAVSFLLDLDVVPAGSDLKEQDIAELIDEAIYRANIGSVSSKIEVFKQGEGGVS